MRRRQTGGCDVREDDLDREPASPLPPVLGHDKEGIGAERHDSAATQVDYARVNAVSWPDEYVVPPRPESREDDILKEVGPDLSDFRCDALCHEKHPPLPGSG